MATKKEETTATPKRLHRATYSRDKLAGGYLVRVEGPAANKFAGREVPVTRRDGSESMAKLDHVVWTGVDQESGKPVALYVIIPEPREKTNSDVEF